MSTYDDASLIMYPSGYKASKIYSLKPTDGSGDLTFTRASTATRVGSDGLIEKVRTNLFLQSQTFDNASWTKDSCVVTANAATAPDGTLTAEKIVINNGVLPTDGFNTGLLQSNVVTTGTYTYSVFAKAAEFTGLRFRERINVGDFVEFNLSTGTAPAGTSTFINPTMVNVGNGWYRCSFQTQSNTLNTNKYALRVGGTGDGTSGIFIWGAQFEVSDFGATPYIPTTTAAVSVGMLANVPRLDYLGGGCGKLLLEPQRSNLVTFSEQFNNGAWIKNNTTITANQAISPSGVQDADKIIPSTGNTGHNVDRSALGVSSNGTASVFLKSSGYTKAAIRSYFTGGYASFDLVNGTILTAVAVTAKIENYGNGWYRCSVNDTANANYGYVLAVLNTSTDPTATYIGDGTSGVLAWGAQLEVGSYPTSYIPTLAAAVTRSADAASKTGISALIGQTQGTLFMEAEYVREGASGNARKLISVNDGSSTNLVDIYVPSGANTLTARVRAGAVGLGSIVTSSVPLGKVKIAYAYKANDYALYINGTQIGVVTTGGTLTFSSALTIAQIGDGEDAADELGGGIGQAILFPTRLTNTQLATLTTL